MKKVLTILLLCTVSTLFAAEADVTSKTLLANTVNVDGTTNDPSYSGDGTAYNYGTSIGRSTGVMTLAAALVSIGIAAAIVSSLDRDVTRGTGHLTHANDPRV